MGFDHSAIGILDIRKSIAFYTQIGLSQAAATVTRAVNKTGWMRWMRPRSMLWRSNLSRLCPRILSCFAIASHRTVQFPVLPLMISPLTG